MRCANFQVGFIIPLGEPTRVLKMLSRSINVVLVAKCCKISQTFY